MHSFGSPSIKSYCDSIVFMTPYASYSKRNKGYKRVVKLRLIQSKSILILFLFFPVSSVLALPHPCGTAAGYQKSYQKHSLCFLHFDQSKVNSKETISASVSLAKFIQKKKKKKDNFYYLKRIHGLWNFHIWHCRKYPVISPHSDIHMIGGVFSLVVDVVPMQTLKVYSFFEGKFCESSSSNQRHTDLGLKK